MNLLLDMNLTPAWVERLNAAGHRATHWSRVGSPRAKDREILAWARAHNHVVLTHDLDFGAILAATGMESPSVAQVRTRDVLPAAMFPMVSRALDQYGDRLAAGALMIVDETRARVRLLPLRRQDSRPGASG